MNTRSSRATVARICVATILSIGVYATVRAYGPDQPNVPAPAAGQGLAATGLLVPKTNYQFVFSQPVVFPGYASASATISAQLVSVQDTWATIQYQAGPNKNVHTAAINTYYVVAIQRLQ